MILKDACDIVLKQPDLVAEVQNGNLVTYCNLGFERIATMLGHKEYNGLMANQIYDKCKKDCVEVSSEDAIAQSMQGLLVIANWKNTSGAHGHVAVIYPSCGEHSDMLNKTVPTICNIGIKNAIMKVTQAFQVRGHEPTYFLIS
jgi:hypothetical protein